MSATFWALVAFLLFFGLLYYLRVHKKLVESLDGRRDRIRDELERARLLREEAQSLLAGYQRKTADVQKEAEMILEEAKREVIFMKQEAEKQVTDLIQVRTRAVEQRVKQLENRLLSDVHARIADLVVGAGRGILETASESDIKKIDKAEFSRTLSTLQGMKENIENTRH